MNKIITHKYFKCGALILASFFLCTHVQAEEVNFAIYDDTCYNFNDPSGNSNTCDKEANYFNAQSQRGYETNLWRTNSLGYTAQWHLPEPTHLTYNYSVVYYVYRDGSWKPLADLGNKVFYGEKVKAEVTKNAEWVGNSGWFWDTPSAHFKDSFDWSDLSGCYAEDYFGETDVASGDAARWNRWGLIDDEGHLGWQGSRLTGPVIFKNPTTELLAAGFTCSGSECTAPSLNGTYTLSAKTSATEARQRFFGLIQPGGTGGSNPISQTECKYPGGGFPDPTRSCREVCSGGACPLYTKMAGETNEQCYARAKNDFKPWWNCRDKGYLPGCMPITYVNLPIAESQRLANAGIYSSSYQKTMPVVEASAYIPGWPKNPKDTEITVTVGPPENSDIPQVTVTPGKTEVLEGDENEITCSVTNPITTEKITQIKWSCLDNSSNQMVNCSLLGSSGWITGSEYVINIPEASQASTYTSVIKAKSAVSGAYTVKCSATNSASITGEGYAGFKVGNCLADGVCNQLCPYDPDCCVDPYCLPYCPGYGNPHCVIAAGSCSVIRTSPITSNKALVGDTVKYQASLFGGVNPIAYIWQCDKNKPDEATTKQSKEKISEQSCVYNSEGTFEPQVDYQYKNEQGNTITEHCSNSSNIGVEISKGEKPVSSCNVFVKIGDSNFAKSTSVKQGNNVDIQVTTNGTRKNPVLWKINGLEYTSDSETQSRVFNNDTEVEATVDGIVCNSAKVKVKEVIWWRN